MTVIVARTISKVLLAGIIELHREHNKVNQQSHNMCKGIRNIKF